MKNISESELEIMKVLWKYDSLTLKEIVNELDKKDWSYSTIRTMVQRLLKKGAIKANKDNISSFKYYTVVSEKDYQKSESKVFLENVFNGSLTKMISTLYKDEKLDIKEIKEIQELIDSMKNIGD